LGTFLFKSTLVARQGAGYARAAIYFCIRKNAIYAFRRAIYFAFAKCDIFRLREMLRKTLPRFDLYIAFFQFNNFGSAADHRRSRLACNPQLLHLSKYNKPAS
jgi:hypothetical protein